MNPLDYMDTDDKVNVTPPTAILSINKSDYAKNEDVTFTFGGENVSNVFTLGIYKDNNRIDTVNVNGSTYTRSFSEVGNYSAYMTSYNDAGYADSNWVNWSVLGKPEAKLSVDKKVNVIQTLMLHLHLTVEIMTYSHLVYIETVKE